VNELPLLGYTDRLSARPGETIGFKVSSAGGADYTARLFRSISADPNPQGPGIIEKDASGYFPPAKITGRRQPFTPGSYAVSGGVLSCPPECELDMSIIVFPTMAPEDQSTIMQLGDAGIAIDSAARPVFQVGDKAVTGSPLTLRRWYRLTATTGRSGEMTLRQEPLGRSYETPGQVSRAIAVAGAFSGPLSIAAGLKNGSPSRFFNGKLEAPRIRADGKTIGDWDFSAGISTTRVRALSGPDLNLINFPTRAVTGSLWDGSEMNWCHQPDHYAAIHFHEDDIYDFGWETDFTFTIPDDMPSGIYVMRIRSAQGADAIPFFVCAPLGRPTAKLCVLMSTFTYAIYGNHARPDYDPSWKKRMADRNAYPYNPAEHPEYGLSTYNTHTDGSGICHASHRRPLFNLRPGFVTFGDTACSGLRHLPADSHLISWLHNKGVDYDIVTDQELHRDGVAAIAGYAAVTTATHPEYHTSETLDALRDYRDAGGALHYLGGNGFYWRIAIHSENDSMLEIRRAEDGIRAWATEPGEYYNGFDGAYGGLWRRNARPPQELVGIGFASQGTFTGAPYQRVCTDPAFAWVFEGIEDEIIGDFGLSGQGAAGFELDHCDPKLGTPGNVTLLARSVTCDSTFMLVPEEQLTHLTNLSGRPVEEAMRADMIYFEVPGGGSVFSTGSITFCGSLPWNDYDNNVSRLLENVLRRSLKRAEQAERAGKSGGADL